MHLPKFDVATGWHLRNSDACLSALLIIQCLMTFVLVPLVAVQVVGPWFIDAGLLLFAVICATVYAERIGVLLGLLCSLLAIVTGPAVWANLRVHDAANAVTLHETILFGAFCFNALITGLVTRHTFGAGRVTRHRILGAVLVYLNVAVLFSTVFDILDTSLGGAIRYAGGAMLGTGPGVRRAEPTYFSLTTLTTCGYGDLVPVHPFVRSLATLEALFGQLFPATFVARLVALHLTHAEDAGSSKPAGARTDSHAALNTDASRLVRDAPASLNQARD